MKHVFFVLTACVLMSIGMRAQTYVLPWSGDQTIEAGAKCCISASATPPAADWYAETYNDASWTSLTQRYYRNDNTPTPYCWQRRKFTLAAAPSQRYMLRYHLDDEGCIYVNGRKVMQGNNCPHDSVNITPFLHAGTNVVAGYVYDSGHGDTYLDMGVYLSSAAGVEYSGVCGRKMNQNTDSTNLLWSLNTTDGILRITGSGAMRDYDWDTRAPWNPYRSEITSVVMTDEATCIGNLAFAECNRIIDIHVGDSVKRVGSYAFYYATALQQIALPHVKTIEDAAFCYCQGLETADFCNSVENVYYQGFYDCRNLRSVLNTGMLRYVGVYSFENDASLCHIEFPEGMTTIEYEAFCYCRSLTSVSIPSTVLAVGPWAFDGCTALDTVVINEGVQTLYRRSFGDCPSIRSLHFPSTLVDLNEEAFVFCPAIDTITVATANPVYDSRSNCNAVIRKDDNCLVLGCANTTFLSGIQSIGNYAFCGCSRLTSAPLPAGLSVIGSYSFEGCSSLSSVSVPNSVTSSGEWCFLNCPQISSPVYNTTLFIYMPVASTGSYTIPAGIQTVSNTAFARCGQLTGIVMPNSVTSCLYYAFGECRQLDTIHISEQLTSLGSLVCAYCNNLRGIYFYDGITVIPYEAFYDCYSLENVHLPAGITEIGQEAFRYCRSLRDLQFPDSLQYIRWYAFDGCISLQRALLPDGIYEINGWAFQDNRSLKEITIPEQLNSLGEYCFNGCDSLQKINWNARTASSYSYAEQSPFYYVRNNIREVVFGDSVRTIPQYLCYEMSNMQKLTIGESVEEIRPQTFESCWGITDVRWKAKNCADFQIYNYAPFYSVSDTLRRFTFGDKVEHIPAYLCMNMVHLDSLYIPASVRSIGNYAFRDVCRLSSIIVDPRNTAFDSRNQSNALIRTADNDLILGCRNTIFPNNIRAISECAFRDCLGFTQAIVPDAVQTIGREAFFGCEDLTTVSIPANLQRIEDYTFTNCRSLKNVLWGDRMEYIGVRSFSGCDSLTSMILPATLQQMGKMSITHCPNMRNMWCLADTVPQIEHNSIDVPCPIYVPCGSLRDYRIDAYWQYQTLYGIYDYRLNVEANDNFFGRVDILQYPDCENDAHLLATPSEGYEFRRWITRDDQAIFSTSADLQFRMRGDISLVAVFALPGEYGGYDALENAYVPEISVRTEGFDIICEADQWIIMRVVDLNGGIVGTATANAGSEARVSVGAPGVYLVNTTQGTAKIIVK